jgi:hypothetical protein
MIGWKLVLCYVDKKWALALAKLEIPADAIVVLPTNSKKLRCDKATVKAIYDIRGIQGHVEYITEPGICCKLVVKETVDELRELSCDGYSIHEMDYFVACVLSGRPKLVSTIYRKGETVSEQDIDVNPDMTCAQGIHFFNAWADAVEWGFTVDNIFLPRSSAYALSVERLLNKLRLTPPVS